MPIAESNVLFLIGCQKKEIQKNCFKTMQRIIIKNFGPIEEVDLEIKDFIVLIGPQASGKSILAKAIYFFKSIGEELVRFCLRFAGNIYFSKSLEEFLKGTQSRFLDYFGSQYNSEFFIKYFYSEEIWIEVKLEKESRVVQVDFSQKFEGLVYAFDIYTKTLYRELRRSTDLYYLDKQVAFYLEKDINSSLKIGRPVFFPAGRRLASILSSQFQYMMPIALGYFTKKFLEKINSIHSLFSKSLPEVVKEFKNSREVVLDNQKTELAMQIINKILKGEYRFSWEGERIFYNEQNYVNLNFSSAGQQEVLWVALFLFLVILEQQDSFIVIEEPETHLFPEVQKEISNLIVLASNVQNSQVIITTHSPYILASFNNLIFAHKQGSKNPQFVNQRIPQELWLDKNKVYAGYVDGGRVEEFIDEELGLMQKEKLDSISSVINEEFNFLFQMKE